MPNIGEEDICYLDWSEWSAEASSTMSSAFHTSGQRVRENGRPAPEKYLAR